MRKRFTRLMSWLLVAGMLLQENVMTVAASELPETAVVESGVSAAQEESTTSENETQDSTETEAVETAQEPETESQEETIAKNKNVSMETETAVESVVEETATEETVTETETAEEKEVSVVDAVPAVDGESNEYGDIEVLGDIVLQDSFIKNEEGDGLTHWNTTQYTTNITSVEGSDDGKSVTITFGNEGLGGDYLSSINLNKSGFALENGKSYKVSYKITSSKARKIKSGFDNTPDRDAHVIELEENVEKLVEYNITTNDAWNSLMFYMGIVDDTPANLGEHTITISDLAIQEVVLKPQAGPEVEDPEDNLIKNGTFKDGTTENWNINKTYADVKETEYRVVFDITRDCADYQNWLMQNVTLNSGSKYKIAVDVESSIDRSILVGFDGGTWLSHKAVKANTPTTLEWEVTGTNGGNFAITLGSNIRASSAYTDENGETKTDAALNQTLGAHRVSISNVRITEMPVELPNDTPNDTPYTKITSLNGFAGYTAEELSPLKDGSFTNGLANWETYAVDWMENQDMVKWTEVEGGMSVWLSNIGDENNKSWDVQLNQKISLVADTEYVLSFKVHSEKARMINVTIADIGENGQTWVKPIAIQKGETREVILNLPELATDAENKLFSIQMGYVGVGATDNTLTFTDMKLEVNGYGELAERITDGNFDKGTVGSFTTEGDAETLTADFVDKYVVANINKACEAEGASINSGKFSMLAGSNLAKNSYTVSFVAGATENRTIKAVLVGDDGTALKEESIELTTEAKNYSFTYTPTTAQTAAYLKLLVGGETGVVCVDTIRCDLTGYAEAKGIDVTAHDIKLLEKKETPAISEMPASDAVAGRDVVLTFEKIDANADYKAALEGENSSITVNGTEVEYTVAENGDLYTITLNKELFSVSGDKTTFDIVIKAPWYESNHIRQSVYATEKWTATWLEEFDGTALDETKWSYQEGTGAEYGIDGWGNNEQQYYSKENLKVADGELVITAQKEKVGNKKYTSARIWTMNDDQETAKFSQTYGRMEAKMKLAGGEGYEGVWPAFWMLPEDTSIYGTWPLSGEIDILEARGREPDKADGTVHYGKPYPNNESSGGVFEFSKSQHNADSDINDYHVYAVEWEPGEIRWYVDDELYYSYSNWYSQSADNPEKYKYPAPFDQNFYIILNLAIGGSFDGNLLPSDDKLPVDMKVDYVRVYQSTTPYEDVTEEPPVIKDEETDLATVKSTLYDKDFAKIEINNANGLVPDVWNLMTLSQFGGSASFNTVTENGTVLAKITPENLGNAAHSIQLMQDLDMVKGYNYRICFDAKTDGSRKLNMKIGQDGTEGWSAYETFETTLTSELQHYVYEFQAGQTDLHSRVEFNIATSMAPVYIGNITYEIIDEIIIDEDVKKAPSENGNHVWNGSFNVGAIDGLTYWHADDTDAKVVREGTGYVFTATQGSLYQNGLYLLKNDTYKLTFDASADAARTIDVIVSGKDGSKVYMNEKDVALTTERGTKTFTFTMPADVSDDDAKLTFAFGESGEKVYITNICLVKTSYNNVNWDEVNAYPLLNGDFELGKTYWSTYGQEFEVVEENGNHYAKANGIVSADKWASMLIYSGMNLTGKNDYTFSFKVRGSKAGETILVTLEDEGNNRVFEAADVAVGEEWTTYTYDLRFAENQNNIALKFQLGGASEAYNVEFDDVVLSAKGAPKAPGIITAASYNRLGEDVVLTYSGDAEWAQNAVVYVEGIQIDAGKVTVADGKLTIDKDVFEKSGSYEITVKSTGYTTSKATKVTVYPMDGNRVMDGGFNGKLEDYWGTSYILNTYDSITIEDGKAKIHYGGAGYDEWGNIVPWAIMLIQEGIPVEQGKKYQISFTASATIDRPIQVMRNQGSEISEYVNISKTPQVYEVEFVSTGDTVKLQFLLSTVRADGGANTEADIFENHDIYIDNVCIKEMVDGKVEVDTTEVTNLIKECEALNSADYTQASWKVFQEALKEAKEIIANPDAKQAEVNAAKDKLEAAKANLKLLEDEVGLWVDEIADVTYTGKAVTPEVTVYDGSTLLELNKDYKVTYKKNKDIGTATVTVTGMGNYDGKDTTTFKIVPKDLATDGIEIEYKDKLVETGKNQAPLSKIAYNGMKLGSKDYKVEYYQYVDGVIPADAKPLKQLKTAGDYQMKITGLYDAEKGKGNYTGIVTRDIKVYEKNSVTDISKLTVKIEGSKSYSVVCDGTAQKPEVEVLSGKNIIDSANYTVDYRDNSAVGTATIIITGIAEKGYIGTITKTFKITATKLSNVAKIDESKWSATVDFDETIGEAVQEGNMLIAKNADSGLTFEEGKDYTVSYSKNTKAGKATVVYTGIGKYTGTIKQSFTVNAITLFDSKGNAASDLVEISVGTTAEFAQKGSKVDIVVEYNGTTLTEGVDYKVAYKNNKAVTTESMADNKKPQVTITAMNGYKGKTTAQFTITQKNLADVTMSVADVAYQNKKGKYMSAPVLIDADGMKLKANKDYTVKYYLVSDGSELTKNDVVDAHEEVKAVVTAKSANYSGTNEAVYTIAVQDVAKAKVVVKAQVYTGSAITLTEADFTTIKVGDTTLKEGTHYEITGYENNINKGNATVTIKGIGNYGGTKKVTFKISGRTMAWWWNLVH